MNGLVLMARGWGFAVVLGLGACAAKISELPQAADISVSGIYLADATSARRVIGERLAELNYSDDSTPHVQLRCFNRDRTQVLTLIFHAGGERDSFSEFSLDLTQRIAGTPPTCVLRDVQAFVTGKQLSLGIDREDLTRRLGPDFIQENDVSGTVIKYTITDKNNSVFLRRYALPVYYGVYRFEHDKLVNVSFGFESP